MHLGSIQMFVTQIVFR